MRQTITRRHGISAAAAAAVLAAAVWVAGAARAAEPVVTQSIEPAEIALGSAAQLTVTESGDDTPRLAPPSVPGLDFVAVGQSQRVQSINGVTTSTSSSIYQVIPQQAGIFTIPAAAAGAEPLVLKVTGANGGGGAFQRGGGGGAAQGGGAAHGAAAAPGAASNTSSSGATHLGSDDLAFVRLNLAKHDLYVGESVPVDLEVGMRDGFVASLNGLPTMNGDAFTLNKLSQQPERTEQIIDGKPFTILTWHSLLAAVKPGSLSLTVETPLTVRMRTQPRRMNNPFGDSSLDDFFNDPMFQNFFGGTTEKDITVKSAPMAFNVQALPTADRPADFSGAVGNFKISSELSEPAAAAGDPLTLRMHVTGSGDFDRVNSPMLQNVENWKTYQPTAKFTASDNTGYRGDKTFEQPLVAAQPGTQTLPALSFSFFDPATRRYEVARSAPLSVKILPGSADNSVARAIPSAANPAAAQNRPQKVGLRADQAQSGATQRSLLPLYYQARFLAIPSLLLVAFSGAWGWMRRREINAGDAVAARARATAQSTDALLRQMERAAAAGNAALFFSSARAALATTLCSRWNLAPEDLTLAAIDARLGTRSDVRQVFELADEANYSGGRLEAKDLQRWKQMVLRQMSGAPT